MITGLFCEHLKRVLLSSPKWKLFHSYFNSHSLSSDPFNHLLFTADFICSAHSICIHVTAHREPLKASYLLWLQVIYALIIQQGVGTPGHLTYHFSITIQVQWNILLCFHFKLLSDCYKIFTQDNSCAVIACVNILKYLMVSIQTAAIWISESELQEKKVISRRSPN